MWDDGLSADLTTALVPRATRRVHTSTHRLEISFQSPAQSLFAELRWTNLPSTSIATYRFGASRWRLTKSGFQWIPLTLMTGICLSAAWWTWEARIVAWSSGAKSGVQRPACSKP
ncbi:hypothetical protein FB451DRAFT_1190769 [Mycena latifolia]|nr:hypothetical protein FB451DRAFT_1190769 [Mycena latifolia]